MNTESLIALGSILGIACGVVLRFLWPQHPFADEACFIAVLVGGGIPLVWGLLRKLVRGEFGSDLLAGISIVTSAILQEYLAGAIVVLMLSGGEALERYALANASSALKALAKRMPNVARRRQGKGYIDITLEEVRVGDQLVVLPHEVAPADGIVIEGRSSMDESYLTGEPYKVPKTRGVAVISGALNGDEMLIIEVTKLPKDSRYSKIIEVMKRAEEERPKLRRLGDRLGALYTPIAVVIAVVAWVISGEAVRFLAVLVIATPCPLLIAIPISIIGGISLSAKRSIIIRNPAVMEQLPNCSIVVLDKTGTLTLGSPKVTKVVSLGALTESDIVSVAGSLERFSKHPLAEAVVEESGRLGVLLQDVDEVSERPGEGLRGSIAGRSVFITNRKTAFKGGALAELPASSGLECVVVIDNEPAGIIQFHDEPRRESHRFIDHLATKHRIPRVMIISGDRESEVEYLAQQVGINEIYSSQTPEQKVERVRALRETGKVLFVGDGVNDAPALAVAHVGVAMGQANDVTVEAAGAVILEASLRKLDELFHISMRMRRIALQSAVGGMALSIVGMFLAAGGYLTPVMGALSQEVIDLLAVLNALRSVYAPQDLTDMD